jgi:pimeloyl-[acyl-carrier protein] methyl ester esterase
VNEALKLVLLPGMDGTGDLFEGFVVALPASFEIEIVRYPTGDYLSYAELEALVRAVIPASGPFLLVAESFSTPLAIQCAASCLPHLRGLVLCAGFATSPVRGWRRRVCSLMAPILFRVKLSETAARFFLVGKDASDALVAAVRAAVSSVQSKVLSGRLREVLGCDVRAELARVAVPVLYIQAKSDRLVGTANLEEIRRIRPEMAVAVVDGPHLLFQREPQRTAEVVVEFVSALG